MSAEVKAAHNQTEDALRNIGSRPATDASGQNYDRDSGNNQARQTRDALRIGPRTSIPAGDPVQSAQQIKIARLEHEIKSMAGSPCHSDDEYRARASRCAELERELANVRRGMIGVPTGW